MGREGNNVGNGSSTGVRLDMGKLGKVGNGGNSGNPGMISCRRRRAASVSWMLASDNNATRKDTTREIFEKVAIYSLLINYSTFNAEECLMFCDP